MGRSDYRFCRQCGRHSTVVGELSHVRLCSECGHENMNEAYDQLKAHTGPIFDWWRYRIAASVGAVPLDHPALRP